MPSWLTMGRECPHCHWWAPIRQPPVPFSRTASGACRRLKIKQNERSMRLYLMRGWKRAVWNGYMYRLVCDWNEGITGSFFVGIPGPYPSLWPTIHPWYSQQRRNQGNHNSTWSLLCCCWCSDSPSARVASKCGESYLLLSVFYYQFYKRWIYWPWCKSRMDNMIKDVEDEDMTEYS